MPREPQRDSSCASSKVRKAHRRFIVLACEVLHDHRIGYLAAAAAAAVRLLLPDVVHDCVAYLLHRMRAAAGAASLELPLRLHRVRHVAAGLRHVARLLRHVAALLRHACVGRGAVVLALREVHVLEDDTQVVVDDLWAHTPVIIHYKTF